MNSFCFALAVAAAALLAGCGSDNDMTPRQATVAINAYFAENPETTKVLTGMNNIGAQPVAEHWETPDGKYQKAMEAAGLITVENKGKIVNPKNHNQFMYALDVQLTERGKRMIRGKPLVMPAPSSNTWDTVYENAVVCTKQVAQIVSLSTTGDVARADYTYVHGSFTPFYDAYHSANPSDVNTCSGQAQQASAVFQRANGVWALAPQ